MNIINKFSMNMMACSANESFARAAISAFALQLDPTIEDISDIKISTNEVNRPGLQLVGFYDLFDPLRIQIIGKTEYSYLKSLGAKMYEALDEFFSKKPI